MRDGFGYEACLFRDFVPSVIYVFYGMEKDWAQDARSSHVQPKHAVIQSRMERVQCASIGMMFHVKQSGFGLFFLKRFFIQAGNPSAAALLCHSEEPVTKNLRTWRMGWP